MNVACSFSKQFSNIMCDINTAVLLKTFNNEMQATLLAKIELINFQNITCICNHHVKHIESIIKQRKKKHVKFQMKSMFKIIVCEGTKNSYHTLNIDQVIRVKNDLPVGTRKKYVFIYRISILPQRICCIMPFRTRWFSWTALS